VRVKPLAQNAKLRTETSRLRHFGRNTQGDFFAGEGLPSEDADALTTCSWKSKHRTSDVDMLTWCLSRLRSGIVLDGKRLKDAAVDLVEGSSGAADASWVLRFRLQQGRYRQIRRMCQLVGLQVEELVRHKVGGLELEGLQPGRWRYLRPCDLRALTRRQGETDGTRPT
jgi:hypothetical protein